MVNIYSLAFHTYDDYGVNEYLDGKLIDYSENAFINAIAKFSHDFEQSLIERKS